MGDSYAEVIVHDERDLQGKYIRNVLILLTLLLILAGIGRQILLLLVLGIIMIPVTITVCRRRYREYEYLLVSEELDITLIKNRSRRKKIKSFLLSELQCMAPVDSSYLEGFHNNPQLHRYDYSSGNQEHLVYGMIFSSKGEVQEVLVEPSEAFLKEVKMRHSSVVHTL